jgi:predicted MFS family arabinose efflux permease
LDAILQRINGRFHFAWVVLALAFLVMLITAGTRATPSVMILPLEHDLGWSVATISLALSINLALFGLMGPFAAAAMLRFGVRRTVLTAMTVLALAVAASSWMRSTWHLQLIWGLIVGCATGATSTTLGATLVNRWFLQRRGFAMGLLAASSATGQLAFLPLLAWVTEHDGWRPAVLLVAAAVLIVLFLVAFLLPEKPASLGLRAYGEADTAPPAAATTQSPIAIALGTLREAARDRSFWLLFFTFFVCGASTNGYIGTHFIAMCGDYGLSSVRGAGMLAAMGIFDIVGTTLSGWLSDRYKSGALLFWYYGLRGLALLYLPYAFDLGLIGLPVFAVFYGLDWVATVPPTVKLTTDHFGSAKAPVVFGWVFTGHQLGAAFAAAGGGLLRSTLGSYTFATTVSGALCILAAVLVMRAGSSPRAARLAAV